MEKYTAPEMEIIEFQNEDVITTSTPDPFVGIEMGENQTPIK